MALDLKKQIEAGLISQNVRVIKEVNVIDNGNLKQFSRHGSIFCKNDINMVITTIANSCGSIIGDLNVKVVPSDVGEESYSVSYFCDPFL